MRYLARQSDLCLGKAMVLARIKAGILRRGAL
jgi:hypothetical protein